MLTSAIFIVLVATTVSAMETLNGKTCYFPFTYHDEVYTECYTNSSRPWCFTSENYTTDLQWDYCVMEPVNTIKTPPKECKFPFIYKEKLYHTCITKDNFGWHWCATTHNYDMDKEAILCDNKEMWQTTKTPEHRQCEFPFVYKGKTYDECTTKDNIGMYWCATTDSFDEDREWRFCSESEEPKCTFPFIYNGAEYKECTDINNHGVFWCATTSNYDVDEKWRACKINGPSPVYTEDGERCEFPFYYDGKKFDECTSYKSFTGKLWCSLTTQYERKYGYCELDE